MKAIFCHNIFRGQFILSGYSFFGRSRPLHIFFDLACKPLHALVKALPGHGVAGADVPRLVQDPFKTEGLGNLEEEEGQKLHMRKVI